MVHEATGQKINLCAIGERARAPLCLCPKCDELRGKEEKYIGTTFYHYDDIDPDETKELSEHQYLLCMPFMFGFILKDRRYGKLYSLRVFTPLILNDS